MDTIQERTGLTPYEARAVQLLATEAKLAMVKVWEKRVCLGASRIAVEFLRSVGISANPIAVDMVYENAAFVARMAEEGEPDDLDTLLRWREEGAVRGGIVYHARERYPDAYAAGEISPDGWEGGHCVVTFKAQSGQRWVLDLTADQSDQPENGIELGDAAVLPVPDDWVKGEGGSWFARENGVRVLYQAHPEDQSYLDTPAWQSYDDPFNMTRSIVMTLQARMKEEE